MGRRAHGAIVSLPFLTVVLRAKDFYPIFDPR